MYISVVIPSRNHGDRVEKPLRAIMDQTLPADRYQVIVVDNGSTDNTAQIVDSLAAEASHVHRIFEPVVGKATARNRGIRESSGEIVLFMDDDILVLRDHLERHMAHHSGTSETIAVLGTVQDVSRIHPSWLEDYIRTRPWMIAPQRTAGLIPLHLATGNASVARRALEEARIEGADPPCYFDPVFEMRQDGELGYRLGKVGVQIMLASDIICYHDHPRGLEAVLRRSHRAGYATAQLFQKHPELVSESTQYLPASPILKHSLLAACIFLFIPTFLFRPVWREPSRKVIGAFLQYQRIRGYQQALKDIRRSQS
jgi:glycosyltransferase involved in cell wall biosynthesis